MRGTEVQTKRSRIPIVAVRQPYYTRSKAKEAVQRMADEAGGVLKLDEVASGGEDSATGIQAMADNTKILQELVQLLALKVGADEQNRNSGTIAAESFEKIIPDFDGETIPVKHWFRNFELNAEAYGLNIKQMYVQARAKMTKTAKLFLEAVQVCQYSELRMTLENEFGQRSKCSAEIHAELRDRKKHNQESFHEYLLQMRKLAAVGDVDVQSVIRYIVDGLQLKSDFRYTLYGCKSFQELQEQYAVYDRVAERSARPFLANETNQKRSLHFPNKQKHCFNCGSVEHFRKDCDAATKCFRCNKEGHMAKNCPGSAADIHVVRDATRVKRIAVNGVDVECLVDTGADVSLVTKSVFNNIPGVMMKKWTSRLRGLGNNMTRPVGCFEAEVIVDQETTSHKFVVIADRDIQYDALLGFDFISKFDLSSSAGGYKFSFPQGEKTCEEINQISICNISNANDEIDVPPQYAKDVKRLIQNYKLAVEREQCESLSKELMGEKQHSQEIQEQDVVIIEAMRKRLETALDAEDELHKQLDMERERCERLQTQLTSLQRAESRRNSSLLLKSPGESPRKSPRADFEAELGERLRSEIKLLMTQNERERERSADAQRSSEREKQRYEKELQERIAYCERLKQEMEKLARDKDSAEQELEHFNERLTLQASEIESLESRLVTLQEAETRRANTRTRQHQELTKLHAEIHELKGKLLAAESSRDSLEQKITQLRFDVSRSAQREAKLAEALAQANDRLAHSTDDTVPAQFLQKMKEINTLLAENTQENRQMAETVQYLVGERIALQKRCEELGANGNVNELEERCRQLLGRYLRVESHRKALVYQKRYLKLTLESYQASEQMAMQAIAGGQGATVQKRPKKKLFKTVALAIIAIQRIKYIGRIWHTGKRIVSKSVFTITQQKNVPAFNVNAPPSPLPVANPKVPTNSSSSNNTNNIAGRLSYAPVSPPLVTFSTLQPIVLPQDYTLQVPSSSLSHNNNNSSSNSNNNNNNNNNNNYNESNLPSLAKLDWATTTPQKQPKRAQPRLH